MNILLLSTLVFAEPISLSQALEQARLHNHEQVMATYDEEMAGAKKGQVRSYFFPTIKAEFAALYWDEKQELALFEGNPCDEVDEWMSDMCNDLIGDFMEPIPIREQQTKQFKVTAVQPITGLYGISQGYRAVSALDKSAESNSDQVDGKVSVNVVASYFTVLKVRQLKDVAQKALEAISEHRERAIAFKEVGMLGMNELLLIEVAHSQAMLGFEKAHAGEILAAKKLAFDIGASGQVEPIDFEITSLPPFEINQDIIEQQINQHPAVKAVEYQLVAAKANYRREQADMIPQVAGLFTYQRDYGLGELSLPQSYYVGIGASWQWGWGNNYFGAKEASATVQKAEIGLSALKEGFKLSAESIISEAKLAKLTYEVSQVSVQQTEEHLRITKAKFEAHTATAADLIEAEALTNKARTDSVNAAFDYLIAVAKVQEALGLKIDPLAGVTLL